MFLFLYFLKNLSKFCGGKSSGFESSEFESSEAESLLPILLSILFTKSLT